MNFDETINFSKLGINTLPRSRFGYVWCVDLASKTNISFHRFLGQRSREEV